MHLIKIWLQSLKEKKTKYKKPPISDSVFRPHKSMEQKDGRWNIWHDVFKRGMLYASLRGLFWPFLKFLKGFFKKHDTWPTDANIPNTAYNKQFYALRKSYENAFEIWLKSYYWQGYKHKKPDYEAFKKEVYNSWTQKSIRWLIDFICLAALEDTIYRELLAVWSFEHQKLMNQIYNPEIPQHHVFYCSYYDGDPRYFQLHKELADRKKQYRMNAEWHQWIEDKQKRFYKEYAKKEQAYLENLAKQQKQEPKLTQQDFKVKDQDAWKKLGQKLPSLTEKKDYDAIITKIPSMTRGDILVLSLPNAPGEHLALMDKVIKEKYKGEGHVILINREMDGMVFNDIINLVRRGEL